MGENKTVLPKLCGDIDVSDEDGKAILLAVRTASLIIAERTGEYALLASFHNMSLEDYLSLQRVIGVDQR